MATRRGESELVNYLLDELFAVWRNDRKKLEQRWERNRSHYLRQGEEETWAKTERQFPWQSDTVLGIVSQKITAVYSAICEILFKGRDLAFGLVQPAEGELEAAATSPEAETQQVAVLDEAEKRIKRQLEITDSIAELKKCLLSALVYGCAYAKTYVTDIQDTRYLRVDTPDGPVWRNVVRTVPVKAIAWKSVWQIWRDMETPSIDEGSGIAELAMLSADELRRYATKKLYFPDAITDVLKSSKETIFLSDLENSIPHLYRGRTKRFRSIPVLEFWATVPRKIVEAFEAGCREAGDTRFLSETEIEAEEVENNHLGESVSIFCVVAGNRIIGYDRYHGPRPYYYVELEPVLEEIGGRGIADNLRYHQKVLNGLVRALEDNVKLANRLILAVSRSGLVTNIESALGSTSPAIILDIDARAPDIRNTLAQFRIEPLISPLLQAINMYMAFADLDSHVPRSEQGQQSPEATTAYELYERAQRFNRYMLSLVSQFDNFHASILNDIHLFNLSIDDPFIPKGNWRVVVLGHEIFSKRVIRLQNLLRLLEIVGRSPALASEVDIRWLLEEIIRSLDLPVTRALLSEADKQQRREAEYAAMSSRLRLELAEAKRREAMAERLKAAAEAQKEEVAVKRIKTIGEIEARQVPPYRPRYSSPPSGMEGKPEAPPSID